MTLAEFAEARRLRVRRDECGDPLIPGLGHVYEHGEGVHLGAMFLNLTPRRWTTIRRKLEAAGVRDLAGRGRGGCGAVRSAELRPGEDGLEADGSSAKTNLQREAEGRPGTGQGLQGIVKILAQERAGDPGRIGRH